MYKEPGHYRREHFRSKGFGDTLCKLLRYEGKYIKGIRKKLNKLFQYKGENK